MRGFDRRQFALFTFGGLAAFILLYVLILMVLFPDISMQTGEVIIYVLGLLLSFFWLWVHYQRIKNLNQGAWLLILAIIPVVGFGLFFYLLLAPPPE